MKAEPILDPWQEEVLAYEGDILLCTGRRVGKTYIMARKAMELMLKNKDTPIVIMSLTEDQAYIFIIFAWNYLANTYPKIHKKSKATLRMIKLPNGSKMIARPAGDTGDGARGYEGGVLIVDEASRQSRAFWMATKPILLTTNGSIWMCSTPFGKQGYFWERFDEAYNKKDPNARFKVYYKSSEEVMMNRKITETWTMEHRKGAERVLEEDKKEMSNLEYGQEYLGLFMEDLMPFFPEELIKKACIEKKRESIVADRVYYMGCDIARMGEDEGTFEILDKMRDDKIIHVENIITRKKLTTETEDKIIELSRLWDLKRIGIDAGAGTLGVSILDHLLRHSETKNKIEAINNRARSLDRKDQAKTKILKEDLYDNLRSMMERGTLRLLNEDSVKQSLASVQYEYIKKAGMPTKLRIFGNNTHVVEGLTRAAILASGKSLKVWIDSIKC